MVLTLSAFRATASITVSLAFSLALLMRISRVLLGPGRACRLAQPGQYPPQLLMQVGERVVAQRNAHRELAVQPLGQLAARARHARERRQHAGLEEPEVDERHAGGYVDAAVVGNDRLVGVLDGRQANTHLFALGARRFRRR